MEKNFKGNVETILELGYGKSVKEANLNELYQAVSKSAMNTLDKAGAYIRTEKVCYFSAEFLVGR